MTPGATAIPLQTTVGRSTAEVGPGVQIFVASSFSRGLIMTATDDAIAHDLAMRKLAALSFDPDSLDRESEVDIWGFHGDE
jgi:hypothetical protein